MSSRRSLALAAIARVARALGDETPQVVFVGGTVTALYPLEDGADVRPTVDVDCIVDVGSLSEYYEYVDRLRARGFKPCGDEGAPLCRLVFDDTRVDFVSAMGTALGPTNTWYRSAITDAVSYAVAPGFGVLAITPIYFVATKLEAFRGRGRGDYQASHDLEDVLAVLSGLSGLREQIASEQSAVAIAVRAELVALAANHSFVDTVPGHFEGDAVGQARADFMLEWLSALSATGR